MEDLAWYFHLEDPKYSEDLKCPGGRTWMLETEAGVKEMESSETLRWADGVMQMLRYVTNSPQNKERQNN